MAASRLVRHVLVRGRGQTVLQTMLERMAGIPDGIRDGLTYYTDPLTSAYYFVPAVEAISRLGSIQDDD